MKSKGIPAAILVSSMVLTARATLIDVYQGINFNYKGTIEAYTGIDSAALNYDYFSHSGDPVEGPNLKFNRGEIFFYDGPEGTTFNAIFNKEKEKPADGNTDGSVSWDIVAGSFSTDPSVLLADDKKELKEVASDTVNHSALFEGRWAWHNNTDGGIIQGLDGPIWILAIDPIDYEGIDSLKAFSADGSRINLNLSTGNRGYLFFVPHFGNIPDSGATLSLLSIGIAGLSLAAKRKT
jgi:hypothetical protein